MPIPADPVGPELTDYERRIAVAVPDRRPRPAGRSAGCWTPSGGPGGPGFWSRWASTCGPGCGSRPSGTPPRCSPRTSRTCCWPRRPAAGPTLGLDPGFRTGVKVAVVDGTGKVVATDTIYPHQPANRWDQSLATLERLVKAHEVELVAIGNGTASRETDRLAADLIGALPRPDQGGGVRGRRVGVFRIRLRLRRNCPTWTSRSAAPSPSPGGCRIRWPSWSRSTPNPSVSASTSTTSPNRCWPDRSTRWSRTA